MNDAATPAETRLERSQSRFGRLVFGGLASLILLWGLGRFAVDHNQTNAETLLLVLGTWFGYWGIFRSDVTWTIGNQEIRIDRKRPFDRTRTEIIKGNGIVGMLVLDKSDEGGPKYCVELQFSSDRILKSPPISDVKRAYEISSEIARQLRLQDIDPVATLSTDPKATSAALDVHDLSNPEIYLGRRASRLQHLATGIGIVLVAGLFGLPFLSKIFKAQPIFTGDISAMLFGLIAVVLVLKYSHYLGRPTLWVIRHDEIRIERISLSGQPFVETIASGDVTKIAVQKHNSEGPMYSIDIDLRSGRRLTSPMIHSESDARALGAEFAKRLTVADWNDGLQAQPTS
jgi:hypothetical protein